MNQVVDYRRTVTVNLEHGLHMVPCSRITQALANFSCDVRIQKDETTANAKNIFELLALAADFGSLLVVEARGAQAEEAVACVANLFETNFGGGHTG